MPLFEDYLNSLGGSSGGGGEGYPGMPQTPQDPNVRATPLTGLGGPSMLNPNMGNINAGSGMGGGGMPMMGPQDSGGNLGNMARATMGRPMFSPGQNVLYRPASSYGVAGPDVFRTTYEKAFSDLGSRLDAYEIAKEAQTREGGAVTPGRNTNWIDMKKYEDIANQFRQDEEARQVAQAKSFYNPGGGGPSGPAGPGANRPAGMQSTVSRMPKYRVDNQTGEKQIWYLDAPPQLRSMYPGEEWITIPTTGGAGDFWPNFGNEPATSAGGRAGAKAASYYNPPTTMSPPVVTGRAEGGVVPPYLRR